MASVFEYMYQSSESIFKGLKFGRSISLFRVVLFTDVHTVNTDASHTVGAM